MKPGKPILLVGSYSPETSQIEVRLKELAPDVHVQVCADFAEMTKLVGQFSFDLVVANFAHLNADKLAHVEQIRQMGHHEPMVLLARISSPEILNQAHDLSAVVFIEKPFEMKDLQGICLKLLQHRHVVQQNDRRYYTNQKVEVEVGSQSGRVGARVFNLSRGGAYFETSEMANATVGEKVQLRIRLQEVAHEYQIEGRVVWTTPQGMWTGGSGFGIAFVKGAAPTHKPTVF